MFLENLNQISYSSNYQLQNILFRFEQELFQKFYTFFKLRPISKFFISGDTFRSFADFCVESEKDLRKLKHISLTGKVVYIHGCVLHHLIERNDQLTIDFNLLSHNDDWGPDELAKDWWERNSNKEVFWFAQNCSIFHPRIIPIPIGLENRRLNNYGIISDFYRLRQELRERNKHKKSRILYGFAVCNNPQERASALKALQECPSADYLSRVNSRVYRERLSEYQFVAAPSGNGLDTHRVWEALYLKTVPIVLESRLTQEWPHLPWYIIKDWSDVQFLSEDRLNDFYTKIPQQRWNLPELTASFWKQKIKGLSKSLKY
jgi:hypothetical protein